MNIHQFAKPISIVVAIIMLLTPIISSASPLWLEENSSSASQYSEQGSTMLENCHEQSGDMNSPAAMDSASKDCCQEQCQCSQMSCQTSAAALSQSSNTVTDDNTRFNFVASAYHSPLKSPSSPPPIA